MSNEGWIVVLLGVAILSGFLEIFIPSFGLLSLISLGSLVVSIVLAFQINDVFGLIYLIGIIILAPIIVSLVLRYIPKTKFGKTILLETETAESESVDPLRKEGRELIGQFGVAESLMMPSGRICINGKSYDAICENGAVDPGETVRVSRTETTTLFVTVIKKK